MTECANCGESHHDGYYYPEDEPLCRGCYTKQMDATKPIQTVSADRAEKNPEAIDMAEQRSRHNVLNNRSNNGL